MGNDSIIRGLSLGFMALALGATPPSGAAENGQPAGRPGTSGSYLEWQLQLAPRESWDGHWRTWLGPEVEKPRKALARSRRMPGATVVVVDRIQDERTERFQEFTATWAPVLARSFEVGWRSPYTGEMLAEFMSMHGANFHPPSIPSVWYNGLVPYWVQQGWASSSGVSLSAGSASANRPMILYPNGRR